MISTRKAGIVLIVLFSAAWTFGQNASPRQTVVEFYKYNRTHSQLVTRRSIDARRRWLSDSLYQLFLKAVGLENEYLKKNPTDKGYFGDGFSFQPYEETCNAGGKTYHWTYSVGNASRRGKASFVSVSFTHPKICGREPTVYKIKLSRTGATWRINDVIYPDRETTLATDMKQHHY